MNKRMFLAGAAIVAFLFTSAYAEIDTLTILHVNDTHSHLLPYGPKDAEGDWTWGGYARIATLVGMSRMTEPNVMLLHGGDLFVGDFMFQEYVGIAELEIMKALNFDALELGNHEFDLYPATLKYALNQAGFPDQGFPVLCANLDLSDDNEMPPLSYFVRPYTIKEIGGLTVGIFGLLTDLANQISNPSPIVVTPPLGVAQAWVDTLRSGHNCDLVILLSHMGFDYDQMAAMTISGIDLIVGGHSHTVIPAPIEIGNTVIVQAGEFGEYLGRVHVFVDNGVVSGWNYDLLPVDSSVPAEPTLAGLISQLAAGVEMDPRFGPVYTNVIASATTELSKPLGSGLAKDTPLGNLAADAFRNTTGTDIAFQPQGFISQTIYAGEIKAADIFQAFPYGFDIPSGLGLKLVTFRTDGMSLIAGLEFSVYNLPYVEDFLLQGSNISYVYDLTAPQGSRVDCSSIAIEGMPLNPMGSYTVTAPDAVVPFLGQIPGFNISDLEMTDYFVYSVARDFITANSPVSYYSEGRILEISTFEEPLIGISAIADIVNLFEDNGLIGDPKVAWFLRHHLEIAAGHLANGRLQAAKESIKVFKIETAVAARRGLVTPFASLKLSYLADKISEIIGGSPAKPFVEGEVPSEFELYQNYPNPFNPQTCISYVIAAESDVSLTVYNVLGEKIRELANGRQQAGTHNVVWDGRDNNTRDVASGIYFYRLQAGDFAKTMKMSLTR